MEKLKIIKAFDINGDNEAISFSVMLVITVYHTMEMIYRIWNQLFSQLKTVHFPDSK